MNIGIVTTWFARGAAYVSINYKRMLEQEGHKVFIFARGGESHPSQSEKKWNENYVTRSNTFIDTRIKNGQIKRWIRKNSLEAVLFNEQRDFRVILYMKKKFPQIKVGAYVDYYTENTIEYYGVFDFLICNTHRHMQAMDGFQNKHYIEWGTDTNLYKPVQRHNEMLTFFHSAGMASRKGTDLLIEAFIKGEFSSKAKLVIHTQLPLERISKYKSDYIKKYNIEVICQTVDPPGLYHLGDVYVYPARLDGLGLTMYEALACGLPLIVSDFPPMNEVGDDFFVKKVAIRDYICRADAYYYPMCICSVDSLISQMRWFVDHEDQIDLMKEKAREYAEEHYNLSDKAQSVSEIFLNSSSSPIDPRLIKKLKRNYSNRVKIVNYLKNFRAIERFITTFRK